MVYLNTSSQTFLITTQRITTSIERGMKLILLLHFILIFSSLALGSGQLEIHVSLNPAGSFIARSSSVNGVVTRALDGSWLAKEVTLDLDTLKSGIDLRDSHMRMNYFETSNYPTAILNKAEGKGSEFTGVLKLRKVSKMISGSFQWEGDKLRVVFACKLSDFDIPQANYLGVGVEDEVEVRATLPSTSVVKK